MSLHSLERINMEVDGMALGRRVVHYLVSSREIRPYDALCPMMPDGQSHLYTHCQSDVRRRVQVLVKRLRCVLFFALGFMQKSVSHRVREEHTSLGRSCKQRQS